MICERGLAEDLAKRCNCACTDPTHLNVRLNQPSRSMVSEHGTIRARRTGIVDLRSANFAQWLRFSQNRRRHSWGSASGISHATREVNA